MYYSRALCAPSFLCKAVFAIILILLPAVSSAASLLVSPRSGSYEVGSTFSVGIVVNANEAAFNAASGKLSFPADLLEVVSISKSSSVISLWVQEPSFSNAAGSVSFEGIVLNPGYKGSNGKVITVQFRVKKPGGANVSFISGEVLANDGVGTSILSALGTGVYTLSAKSVVPTPEPPSGTTPSAPASKPAQTSTEAASSVEVTSNSHPQDAWSNKTDGTFAFNFSDEVVAMRLLADDVPDSIPVVIYQPPIKEKSLVDLTEGVSYLHVQLKDKSGWGEVNHYKLQIDTKAPEQITVKEVLAQAGAELKFLLTASDTTSGIDRYEISIDGGESVVVPATGAETYFSPQGLVAGIHTMDVKAFDKAGNSTTTKHQFESLAVQKSDDITELKTRILQSMDAFSIALVTIPLLLLIGLLLWLYLLTRARQQEQQITLITHAAKHDAVRAIMLLRTELEDEIKLLEKTAKKRTLTKEESKVLKGAKKSFAETESYIDEYFSPPTTENN